MNKTIYYTKAESNNNNQMKSSHIVKCIIESFIYYNLHKMKQIMELMRSIMRKYDIAVWIIGDAAFVAHNLICLSYFLFGDLYGILFLYGESIKYWFRVDLYHYIIVILTFVIVTVIVFTFIGIGKSFYWGILLSYILSICILNTLVSNKSYLLFGGFGAVFITFFGTNFITLLYRKRGRKFKNIKLTLLRIFIKSMAASCTVIPVIACVYFGKITIIHLERNIYEKIAIEKIQVTENYFAFSDYNSVYRKFRTDSWATMPLMEKEVAATELCQINLLYLTGHKSGKLRFVIREDYQPLAGGFYSENFHEIVADYKYADNRDHMLNLICHECYHYFQHRLLNKEKDKHELVSEEKLHKYKKEFADYIDIDEDFEGYYNQQSEIDAREYAERMQNVYLRYINDFTE